jgi:hypothetical protein
MVADATKKWIVPALGLGVGVPALAGVGLGIAFGVSAAADAGSLPASLSGSPIGWVVGFAVALCALWFLVLVCVRAGGLRALWTGSGVVAVVCLALWRVAAYQQAQQPDNVDAGFGVAVVTLVFALWLVPTVIMGLVASRLPRRT